MIDTVNEYNNYLERIPELINNTYYKAGYFVKALGISQATYYRKLRENAFTSKEVTILTKLLFPKETYTQELLDGIAQGREDIKNGNTYTKEEAREIRRKKIAFYQNGSL